MSRGRVALLGLLLLLIGAAPTPLRMSDRLSSLRVERTDDGDLMVVLSDGRILPAEQFVEQLQSQQRLDRAWWQVVFDVSAPASLVIVGLGLLGQILFTGRMVVQWLASEKAKRSTVPPAFWWMSIGGASLLLFYFTWRRDLVGVLGQATGWGIYARNLWLIHKPKTPADPAS